MAAAMPEEVYLSDIVRGRVQGVGFRYFVARQGQRLGLRGYASNLPDGNSVGVVARGERECLTTLVELLRKGSPASFVEAVEVTWDAIGTAFFGPRVEF